jgi:DnaJ-class molecular chaperone
VKITIGGATQDCMSVLGVQTYPFTSRELSSAFRTKLKEVHPDMNDGGDKKQNAETRKVIEAYKHLKNLAIDPQKDKEQEVIVEEEKDIFALYEICPECHGSRKRTVQEGGYACPNCTPMFPSFGWLFGLRRGRGFNLIRCNKCNGTGKYLDKGICFKCNGQGVTKIRCSVCHGSGYKEAETVTYTCSNCGGKGKIKIDPFNPVIPKGAVLGKGNKIDKVV